MEAAISLAENGIPVFPLNPKDKTPITKNGVKDATTDISKIKAWWIKWPLANVAVPMGKASGLIAVDIDYKDGCDPKFLEKLPPTVIVKSPNGGHHAYFKYKNGPIKNNLKLEKGATIRSDGYYFVVPPSELGGGKCYEFINGDLTKVDLDPPEWFSELGISDVENRKPFEWPGTIHDGQGREENLFKLASSLRSKNLSYDLILAGLIAANNDCVPLKPMSDLERIAKSVCRYEEVKPKTREKKAAKIKKSPHAISREFLESFNYLIGDKCNLRYYQQDFYKYKNNHYQIMEDEWLRDKLNRWLVDVGLEDIAGTDKLTSIFNMIKTKPVYIGSKIEAPCFINKNLKAVKTDLIPLKNGLFNVRKFIKEKEIELIEHSSDYFYKYILPYELNISAECPTYEKIVSDVFSSSEEILAWEEVMGVHIFCPFLLERFFILSGEGANGKSVLRTILSCLLGFDNISTVPLECFNPNSFAFINTLGKLANIIPDMKDISEIDEGVLKQFISREPMIFNRKNKPFITSTPTAFLTVCTNVLPKFTDKSDGVWRRMILFNFKKEIPRENQNPKFRETEFWNESGELPGIFNKALAGIIRVANRGDIGVTEEMQAEVEEYRHELNFVMQFATECLIFNKDAKSKSSEIYQKYKEVVIESGGRPLGAPTFARQLRATAKKMGYKIDFSEANQRIGSYVGRIWWGIQLKVADPFIPLEAHSDKT